MSRIDELIAELCPDGVPHLAIGDIGTIVSGLSGKTKADFSEGNARYISFRNVYNNMAVDQTSNDFVRVRNGEKQNELRLGDILFTGSSETPDDVGMSSVVLEPPSEPLYLNSFCFGVRPINQKALLPGYSKYVFRSTKVRQEIAKAASGVTRFNISKGRFVKIRIPVPPLEVQREIVRVLDIFTELEAELEARRQEIEWFRDALINSSNYTHQVTLGEVADFQYGITRKSLIAGTHRFIRITDISQQGKLSFRDIRYVNDDSEAQKCILRNSDILVARTGASYGKTMLYAHDIPSVFASYVIRISFKEGTFVPAFYWHFAQSNAYWRQADGLVSSGGQPQFNANALKMIRVPMPSIAEQRRIVAILDKFDALVNDLSIGLPAELAARRKQYEYYRDRLLTFKEKVA